MSCKTFQNDKSSFANPDEVYVSHMDLHFNVDFIKQTLDGKVILTAVKNKKDASHLALDTRDLSISSVTLEESKEALEYTLADPLGSFGSKLTIKLPTTSTTQVVISYSCSVHSTALQWLTPEQTSGKLHPYMYNHCEAIHCRSMIPCQDSPQVKSTYTAQVVAPADLTVLMSAPGTGSQVTSDTKTSSFSQTIPIPAYLIAIVVGDLESRKIGPRSHVWAEKSVVDAAAYEFGETEQMLCAAESIVGPYVWGIYDILVLPSSFPFGGMENPCLTFATPTLLAGDRSLANVVAHEIAHSWTGNLVTNATWEHFWLNEGFTVFLERKIMAKLKGGDYRDFSALGGLKELKHTLSSRGYDDPLTNLCPNLTGVDPDDAFSTVPYEKGQTFLCYLEQLLGGPSKFDPFLHSYIEEFAYKSLVSSDLKDYLYKYFSTSTALLDTVDWDAWLHTPGLPPVIPDYDKKMSLACIALVQSWLTGAVTSAAGYESLESAQKIEFLALLLEEKPLSREVILKLQELYSLHTVNNSEIRFRWIRLCIRAQYKEVLPLAVTFITQQGRMKFVRPIYRDMYEWESSRELALSTFTSHRAQMMHVCSNQLEKDLHIRS